METIENNLGLVAKLVLRYWRLLPASCRTWYSVEDMMQDVILQVVEAWPKFRREYGVKRSTYLWSVVRNRCRHLVQQRRAMKRSCTMVPLEEVLLGRSPVRSWECKDTIETIIAHASSELRDLLAYILGEEDPTCVTPDLRREFQSLVQQHRATYDDFREVIFAKAASLC